MTEERPELTELSSHFEELAGLLVGARSGPPDPERVVRFAAQAVPHSAHCGLTLIPGSGRPRTVASTGELPRQLDVLQFETAQGPCLDAATESDIVRADNLESSTPWPAFARRCVTESAVRSMFCVRLFLSGGERAAMNFYAEKPEAFDDLDLGVGAIFGPYAALSLENSMHEEEAAQLHIALTSSRQIGTAIGILMARELITSEEAFAHLVYASQHLNRKLRDIAVEVQLTGKLPEVPAGKTDG